MIAYEIYWSDGTGKEYFIGILPERRTKSERITKESVLNWGRKVIGEYTKAKGIFFATVEM